MPRHLRIEFPGAFYHVMARGNRREVIFHDDDDRRFFLATLSEACAMTGWRVHAWVLMDNHYHLFIETPEANLVAGMKWLQNTVTRRYNVRHRAWGRLFGDRYKAVPVDGSDGYHYRTLADYIHLNPVRARMIQPQKNQSILDYAWSSVAGGWALPPGKRPPWLAATGGLERFEQKDTVKRVRIRIVNFKIGMLPITGTLKGYLRGVDSFSVLEHTTTSPFCFRWILRLGRCYGHDPRRRNRPPGRGDPSRI